MLNTLSLKKISCLSGALALTLTVGVTLSGCTGGANGPSIGNETVVSVNGVEVKKSEYQKVYDEFARAFNLETLSNSPQRQMVEDTIKQMTMNKLILNALVRHDADKMGIKITDADVKEYKEKEIYGNEKTKAEFEAFLDQNLMSEAQFDDALKETLLLNKFLEKKGGKEVAVSETEVKQFYDANKEQFVLPERIQAKHILVKFIEPQFKKEYREKHPNVSDSELAKAVETERSQHEESAEKLFSQVKAAPDKFEELAKKHSDDKVSGAKGGELGYMVEANIDPTFWEAVKKSPDNKLLSKVLETPFGYHIIFVEDHEPATKQSFAEAKPMIQEHLSQQKKQMVLMRWASEQKASADIDINPKYDVKPQQAQGGPGGPTMPGGAPAAAPQQAASKSGH